MLDYHREKTSGTLLPNLTTEEPAQSLGPFAIARSGYLKENRPALWASLLAEGALAAHLAETERLAQETADDMTARMAAHQGVNERLKEADPMAWAAKMGAIREEARSAAMREIVYA